MQRSLRHDASGRSRRAKTVKRSRRLSEKAMRPRPAQVLSLLSALALGMTVFASPSLSEAASPAPIQFTRFASAAAFARGIMGGVVLDSDRLIIASGASSGTWLSPPIEPGFAFTRLVASWNADTPADGRLRVDAQGTTVLGETSDWYALGTWAADDHTLVRTSTNGQTDALGKVDTDTLAARADAFASYALRVRLDRASSDDPSPSVRMLGAQVSAFKYSSGPTSTPLASDTV